MSSERDDMFFDLEQQLAQVGRKLSAEDASSLIADDFVEFGSSGKVWSKAEIIERCQSGVRSSESLKTSKFES